MTRLRQAEAGQPSHSRRSCSPAAPTCSRAPRFSSSASSSALCAAISSARSCLVGQTGGKVRVLTTLQQPRTAIIHEAVSCSACCICLPCSYRHSLHHPPAGTPPRPPPAPPPAPPCTAPPPHASWQSARPSPRSAGTAGQRSGVCTAQQLCRRARMWTPGKQAGKLDPPTRTCSCSSLVYCSSRRASRARAAASVPSLASSTRLQCAFTARMPACNSWGAATACGWLADRQHVGCGGVEGWWSPAGCNLLHTLQSSNCCAPAHPPPQARQHSTYLQLLPLQVDGAVFPPAGLRLFRHRLPQRRFLCVAGTPVRLGALLRPCTHRLYLRHGGGIQLGHSGSAACRLLRAASGGCLLGWLHRGRPAASCRSGWEGDAASRHSVAVHAREWPATCMPTCLAWHAAGAGAPPRAPAARQCGAPCGGWARQHVGRQRRRWRRRAVMAAVAVQESCSPWLLHRRTAPSPRPS